MPNATTGIAPDAVANELERIAASPSFRKADRCVRLLRYVTGRALEGRGGDLKEYALGVSVFDRPDSFDPRTDPVVRLEARRLRLKLAEYYTLEGLDDPIVIELPKGAYVPYFRARLAPPEPVRSRPPILLWSGAAVAILALAAGIWYMLHRRAERPPVRASIAVLGFRDLSSRAETSWIDPAVSELMNIELGAGQQLRTMPAENVARMRTELSVTPQTSYPAQTLERMGANLGIDYVVAGAYQPSSDRVRLDVVLFDARSGQRIAAVGEEGDRAKLSELAQSCARRIRAHLGVRLAALPGASAYPPLDPAAMESYARGMERLRQSDALGARPYLETAASTAPSNPLVHSGLAAAWSMLGLDNRAREEAKLAFDSSAGLGRVEQLEIEGRYREMAHDWARAVQVYQALFTLLPDDLEYGLLLAYAQGRGGKAQDALLTIDALRRLPAPLKDDPRIDMREAQAAGALADFAHTRRAAHAAGEKASRNGARLQYARARLLEAGAMQDLGLAGYADVRAEARRICAELGDRACVAGAYRIEGNSLAGTGSPAAARPLYIAALQIAGEIGNQLEKVNGYAGLAYVENRQGDLKAAETDYRAALQAGSEMEAPKRYPLCVDLSEILAEQGRIAEARALAEEALAGARQSGDQETIGTGQAALARVLADEGRFPESMAAYNEAIRGLRALNDPSDLGWALLEMGHAQIVQGDVAGARKAFEEARDLDRKYSFVHAEVDLAFASLSLAEGQADEAASRARSALDLFTTAGREGDRLEAAAMLARALIAHGNPSEASSALAQVPSPDGHPYPIEAVVEYRIARCLVNAQAGRREDADRALEAIAAQVSRLGLAPLAREARLAREAVVKTANLSHAAFSH